MDGSEQSTSQIGAIGNQNRANEADDNPSTRSDSPLNEPGINSDLVEKGSHDIESTVRSSLSSTKSFGDDSENSCPREWSPFKCPPSSDDLTWLEDGDPISLEESIVRKLRSEMDSINSDIGEGVKAKEMSVPESIPLDLGIKGDENLAKEGAPSPKLGKRRHESLIKAEAELDGDASQNKITSETA